MAISAEIVSMSECPYGATLICHAKLRETILSDSVFPTSLPVAVPTGHVTQNSMFKFIAQNLGVRNEESSNVIHTWSETRDRTRQGHGTVRSPNKTVIFLYISKKKKDRTLSMEKESTRAQGDEKRPCFIREIKSENMHYVDRPAGK